jgi:hypothetical protein
MDGWLGPSACLGPTGAVLNLPLREIETQIVQPMAQSLYRMAYPGSLPQTLARTRILLFNYGQQMGALKYC